MQRYGLRFTVSACDLTSASVVAHIHLCVPVDFIWRGDQLSPKLHNNLLLVRFVDCLFRLIVLVGPLLSVSKFPLCLCIFPTLFSVTEAFPSFVILAGSRDV